MSSVACSGVSEVVRAIQRRLPGYRATLEDRWSLSTIHPDYTESYRVKDPLGQCGVSSAWLARQLSRQFHVTATYCYGSLNFQRDESAAVPRHCWVEIDIAGTVFIVDLTADQATGFDEQIVFESESGLRNRGLHYDARVRKGIEELLWDPVWPRVCLLSQG
jgi:hypothetical protein